MSLSAVLQYDSIDVIEVGERGGGGGGGRTALMIACQHSLVNDVKIILEQKVKRVGV